MADGAAPFPTGAMFETGLARVELYGGDMPRSLEVGCEVLPDGGVRLSAATLHEIGGDLALGGTIVIRPVTDETDSPKLEDAPHEIISSNGAISANLGERTIRVDGEPVYFPTKQFDLLSFLMEHEGTVVPRMVAYERIWGDRINRGGDRTLDVHVRRIRERLGDYGECLQTVHGQGHMFSSTDNDEMVAVYEHVYASNDPDKGVLVIDPARRELVVNGEVVKPTKNEYDLLTFLMTNQGLVVSPSQISDAVGDGRELCTVSVRVRVARLRARLGPFAEKLETVMYHGYRLCL